VDRDGGLFSLLTGHKGAHALTLRLVGTIGHKADPPANTWPNCPTPNPSLIPSEIEHEVTNRMASPEHQPPSRQVDPLHDFPSYTQETTSEVGGSVFESIWSKPLTRVRRTVSPYLLIPNVSMTRLSQGSIISTSPMNHPASPGELPIPGGRETNPYSLALYLRPTTSTQSTLDGGGDLDSLTDMDYLDITHAVSF